MITCVCTNERPDDWDVVLKQAGTEANFLQSGFWADLICTLDEAIPHYIRIVDGSIVLAQALFLQRWPYNRSTKKKLSMMSGLECYDGPVILQTEQVDEIVSFFIESSSSLAQQTKSTNTVIAFSHTSRWANSSELQKLFKKHGFTAQKWGTALVDLTPDDDALFMSIAHASRKCIKKCQRQDVHIETMKTYEEFQNDFMPNYNAMENAHGRPSANCTLSPPDDWGEYYTYFIAKSGDDVLGALAMFMFNGVATEIQSTMSPMAYEKKLPVQDLLHWELMLEAKRLGCHTFDLAGFNPNPTDKKEAGIARFKGKWGGQAIEYTLFKKETLSIQGHLLRFASRVKASAIARLRNIKSQ